MDFGICRYRDEVERLYQVLDSHLQGREYLVGDKLSYADITAQPWCVASRPPKPGERTGRVVDRASLAPLLPPPSLAWLEYRIRCHFWAGVPLSASHFPHLHAWHDRIEQLPVILDALRVPSQDLVTRIKNDPELEARITAAMKRRREEAAGSPA